MITEQRQHLDELSRHTRLSRPPPWRTHRLRVDSRGRLEHGLCGFGQEATSVTNPVACAWLDLATERCFHRSKHPTLLALEAAVVELQRATVFSDDAHDLFRCAVRDVDLNLQGQPDVGSHDPGQVSNNGICDHAGVTS